MADKELLIPNWNKIILSIKKKRYYKLNLPLTPRGISSMKITPESWTIIINPKSGKRQFRQQQIYLFKALRNAGIKFEHQVTLFAGHATTIAKLQAQKGYKNFIVIGGDGTISEVINGVFSAQLEDTSSMKIAIIPKGTGNDWARFWGLTLDYKHSIDIFLKAKVQLIDIGRVNFTYKGEEKTHFFINSVGFGLDAAVVSITQRMKKFLGSHSFLYTIALLTAVFTYKTHKVNLKSKEKNLTDKMFTMNVANGCYSGGGMKQNPNALPYDGLLDTMLAKKPTFSDIFSILGKLFNGKILEHPIIESFQTQELIIESDKSILMEADGIVINTISPIRINIIPSAIQMIVP